MFYKFKIHFKLAINNISLAIIPSINRHISCRTNAYAYFLERFVYVNDSVKFDLIRLNKLRHKTRLYLK